MSKQGIMTFRVDGGILFIVLSILFVDSARSQIQIPEHPVSADTSIVQALIDSSYEYSFSDPDSAIQLAEQALELSKAIEFKKGAAGAHRELGYSWGVKGDFARSLDHYETGVAINRQMGDTLGLISLLNDIGTTYKSQSKYDVALEYFFKSLNLCETFGFKRGLSANLGNIGLVYFEMDEDEKALEFYTRALEINKSLDNRHSLSINYNNLGLLYGDQGKYDKAIGYHRRALEIRRELGYTLGIANSLNNIGRLYMQQKQYSKALDYLQKAHEVNDGRDPDLDSIIQENLAKTYISAGAYDSALVHARKTLKLSFEYGTKLGEKVGYELLTKIYKEMGEYEKALESQHKLLAVKDSILNAEKTRQINELQTKYETAQKEQEIALLEQEKEQEAMLRNAFLAGLILIGIIGVLIYNRQRLKIKKNRTELENTRLKEQQLEKDLEFRNKQLTTHTLHLVQKNETMKELKEKIGGMKGKENGAINRELQGLANLVDYSFNLDEDWEQFQLYFEQVHTGFFDRLKEEYPDLTPHELRLAALAKLNLSIKETATILGITPNSVKTARYRLRKKLDIETDENLTEFMMEVEKEALD